MNTAKIYQDSDGNDCSIMQMVRREPSWAANRVQAGEDAIKKLEVATAAIEQLRDAANVALGHLTGGMDGDWGDCDPAALLRSALNS